MSGLGQRGVATLIGLATLTGCAPTQMVALELAPAPVSIYVDGRHREAEGTPSDAGERRIELRSDVPHVLFFKRDGYRPERVVLTSEEVDGEPRLRPERVVVRLDPLTPVRRELTVELDERTE